MRQREAERKRRRKLRAEAAVLVFERQVAKTLRGQPTVSYTSRGRRYTFYRHVAAGRIMVKVGDLPAYRVRPEVEGLAQRLRAVRVCPLCSETFPRNGKQRFCSTAHAAQWRKRRWRRRQDEERRRQATTAVLSEVEASKRRARATARRRQRVAKRRREALERMVDDREQAFRLMGGRGL